MATPSEADDSLLKRRARRRLIGAIAMALAAVIVLPMVFDAEKKPLDADISIQIPNKDAVVTKGPGALATVPPAASSAEAKKEDAAKDAPAVTTKPDPKSDAKSEAKGEAKSDVKAEVKAESKSPAKDAAPKDGPPKADDKRAAKDLAEEKRAAAILNAQADGAKAVANAAEKSASGEGGFAVQVGAFATEEKVKEARDKLSGAGIKTFTETLQTKDGERTRVRAGPYPGKDAADAARDKIKALGFAGAVVVAR